MVIKGCTNKLAVNYNSSANFNDGSCVFLSGCTQTFADNYNQLAVIDDGSCYCGESNTQIFFNNEFSGLTITDDCDYILSYKFLLNIDCKDILNFYLENSGQTLTTIFENISHSTLIVDISGQTIFQKTQYENSISKSNVNLYNTSGLCETFYDVLSEENNYDCNLKLSINKKWVTVTTLIPNNNLTLNREIFVNLNNKGLPFNHQFHVDDVSLNKICKQSGFDCKIIPLNLGFDLSKEKSTNNKIYIDAYENKIPTNDFILRLNPYQYIENDVINYFNSTNLFKNNDKFRNLDIEKIKTLKNLSSDICINDSLNCLYEYYLNNGDCPLISKKLGYEYVEKIYDLLNKDWFKQIKKFVPSELNWNNGDYYYKNLKFHGNQYQYFNQGVKYDTSGSTIYCELICDDICEIETICSTGNTINEICEGEISFNINCLENQTKYEIEGVLNEDCLYDEFGWFNLKGIKINSSSKLIVEIDDDDEYVFSILCDTCIYSNSIVISTIDVFGYAGEDNAITLCS
jgi:hypothetical protein